jgi:translation initiation factor IF-3
MDYGRFRYEASRKERTARKAQKSKTTNELREVRFKTRIGIHDRSAKTRLVKRLLGQGAKVKVSVMFRGREITHPEVGMSVLKAVADELTEDALVEKAPSFEGRFLTMILMPAKNNPDKATESEPSLAAS